MADEQQDEIAGRRETKMPVSPIRVFFLVLLVIFFAEAGVMLLLPLLLPRTFDEPISAVIDAFMLTTISAPILWYVIIGPLRRWEREAMRVESLDAIAQLATGVAHEVRNPLTSIKMLVQSHLQAAESPALREDLKVIEDEIRRMETTLNSFLDFARPRPPRRTLLELSQVVQRSLLLLEGRVAKQHVKLVFEPPAEPFYVRADPQQLKQVLLNLGLNALEMMSQGGALDIRIEHGQSDQAYIVVTDTGPGVAPQHVSRLFEPFFTTRETGVGLGLVISRRIARDHGGDLAFQNRPEGGACFTVRLPTTTEGTGNEG